jgi:tetratricopeptide (TPR) repeat protein
MRKTYHCQTPPAIDNTTKPLDRPPDVLNPPGESFFDLAPKWLERRTIPQKETSPAEEATNLQSDAWRGDVNLSPSSSENFTTPTAYRGEGRAKTNTSSSLPQDVENTHVARKMALNYIREGDKYAGLKSVLRIFSWLWKLYPDWETAAENYVKATKFLRTAKAHPTELRDAHLKAAGAYEKLQASSDAAGHYRVAAGLVKDDRVLHLYERAADLYAESGQVLMEAECCVEAGNIVRKLSHALYFASKNADSLYRALSYYQRAIDIYQSQDKYSLASKTYDLIVDYLVLYGQFEEALDVTDTQIRLLLEQRLKTALPRIFLRQIILCLSQGRLKAARTSHLQYLDFNFYGDSQESNAADDLLKAFESQNHHQLQHCLQYSCFNRLQSSVRDLSLRVGG